MSKKTEIAWQGWDDDPVIEKDKASSYERESRIFVGVDSKLVVAYREAEKQYETARGALRNNYEASLEQWMREHPGEYTLGGWISSC